MNDGATPTAKTVLGTAKVGSAADGSLVFSGLADADAIEAAFEYAPHDTLAVKTTLAPSALPGSTLGSSFPLTAFTAAMNEGRSRLIKPNHL